MVILVLLLVAAVICIAVLAYKLREWKIAYDIGTKGLALHLKDAQAKLEDLDKWKKACWNAEARQREAEVQYFEACDMLDATKEDLYKVTNQKKSSEVRTGLIAEQLAPFIGGFPYNPKDAHFMGKPIDFVVFDETGVHFVEVKSGEAKLTDVQRRIKKDIEENRVSFETFRINGG